MRSFSTYAPLWKTCTILLAPGFLDAGFLKAEDLDLKKMLPASTVIYLEVQSFESVLSHPFVKTLQSTSAFKKLLRSPNVLKLRGGLTLFEFAIGDKADSIVRNLSANGLHIAVDKNTEGVVLLAESTSQEWIEDYLRTLAKLARKDAVSKNQADPLKESEYRGIHGFEFQKLIIGNIGPVLIVTNKAELGKGIIDRHLDSKQDYLSSNPLFLESWAPQKMSKLQEGYGQIARVFIDIDTLRQAGVAKDLLTAHAQDFPAELLLGGVLTSLQKTRSAVAELRMGLNRLSAHLCTPYDKQWNGEARAFFVGPDSNGFASALVNADGLLASVNAYRNISELWNRAGDLFDQKVNDQLAQADNQLTTLFSGKDFGTDILGAIEPQIQLIAAEQKFDKTSAPSIQLPSFGIVAKLKDPSMQKGLKRTFQSFIGFLNVVGSMEGNPQLDLDSEVSSERQIYSATYLKESDKNYENGLPIQFNFSPTLAFDRDLILLTSTIELSKKVTLEKSEQKNAEDSKSNTSVNLDVTTITRILEANRQQMISQNILEKGHTRLEAEAEIETLFQLLSLFKTFTASLEFNEQVNLQLNLDLNEER